MKRLLILALLAACGSPDTETPDAKPYNPTGTWKLTLDVAAACGSATYTATSDITVQCNATSPVSGCTIAPYSGPSGEEVLPGYTLSCTSGSCDGTFSLTWSDTAVHLQEFQAIHFEVSAIGHGQVASNAGSDGCSAPFSFVGTQL